MKALIKNFLIIFLVLLIISGVFSLFSPTSEIEKNLTITDLVQKINQGDVKKIVVSGDDLLISYQNDTNAISHKETETSLSQSLINYGVDKEQLIRVGVENQTKENNWLGFLSLISIVAPLLLFGLFFWSIFKQSKAGAMQAFDFTKAKARLFGADGQTKEMITFKDVAGLKEAKEELQEIVDFLKNPKKYLKMGARIPRGVLLVGPSGVGKTMLARAVAGESNVPFFSISGSEFVELFVGVGASRARDLFATAKKAGTSIIFIDELDAVGRARGSGMGGGHDEREQTLNQILVEMDGFERNDTRIVMAATNRPDVLDSALLRPGRFDRKIILDLPDIEDREQILKIHCKGKPMSLNVNLREMAERTPGFSGADLANVINEAALLSARKNKTQVFQEDLLESIEKVLLGPERKSYILSKKEKEIAAFHEAGHALAASFMYIEEPVRKVSIVARGMAAGYTLKVPTEEKKMKTKSEFLNDMAILLAGFSAEKIKFKEITTGAANDLARATELARRIVMQYGMSSLGPVTFGEKDEMVYLGREISGQKNYSEKVAAKIDKEVAKLINDAQKEAEKILIQKKDLLDKVAKTLIEKETIERKEFEELIGKKEIKKNKSEPILELIKPSTKKEKSINVKIRRV
ncbi:MAG: ATP-dependent zinc metalloprotease FtsH [Patescibacteria group bacterium]|nr:ATP-dependent zinc metalloprotease FtsH [Patescibacteria group bacterium]MBU1877149.1 ATP-dependent zinc metalloprotease FtsH [Patescibacteria group bacterium]